MADPVRVIVLGMGRMGSGVIRLILRKKGLEFVGAFARRPERAGMDVGPMIGLGTDLGRVTFYHCLEEIEDDFPIDVFTPDSPIDVACRDGNGQVHQLSIKAHDPEPARRRIDQPDNEHLRSFFQDRFEQHAGLSWHKIGEADSWLIEAKKLYAEIKQLMQAGITIYSIPSDLSTYRRAVDSDNRSGTT